MTVKKLTEVLTVPEILLALTENFWHIFAHEARKDVISASRDRIRLAAASRNFCRTFWLAETKFRPVAGRVFDSIVYPTQNPILLSILTIITDYSSILCTYVLAIYTVVSCMTLFP